MLRLVVVCVCGGGGEVVMKFLCVYVCVGGGEGGKEDGEDIPTSLAIISLAETIFFRGYVEQIKGELGRPNSGHTWG